MTDTVTSPAGPLAGITVLDASTSPAGAMASMLLSDSGADVLRVETGGTCEVDPVAYRVWHRGQRSEAHATISGERRRYLHLVGNRS